MRRNRSIESLSSISSNSSESESDEDDDDDSKESSDHDDHEENDSHHRRSETSLEKQKNKQKKKKKKRRKSKRNHSQKVQDQQQQQSNQLKRQGTLRITPNRGSTIIAQQTSQIPEKKRSNSIDSPQRIKIRRSKTRQMTEQQNRFGLRVNQVENSQQQFNMVNNQLQSQSHSQQVQLQQQKRRLMKSKTINEIDNPHMFQYSGANTNIGNSRRDSQIENEDDFNIGSRQRKESYGFQKHRASLVDANLSSNDSTTSVYQLNPKKSTAYLLPSQTQIPTIQLIPIENQEIETLKADKQELQNKLNEQTNKLIEIQKENKINLPKDNNIRLSKDNDKQYKGTINNNNNKFDTSSQNMINPKQDIMNFDRNKSNVIREKNNNNNIHHLNTFDRQDDDEQKRKSGRLFQLVNYLDQISPFKKYLERINDTIGRETVGYFQFLAYIIFLHSFLVIVYLYFYIDHFKSTTYSSAYQSFFSYLISHNYSKNTQVSYATTFILMGIFQVLLTLLKLLIQGREEVGYKAQQGKQLKTFRVVFNSWNMRVKDQNYVERMKASISKRMQNELKNSYGGKNGVMYAFGYKRRSDLAGVHVIQRLIMLVILISLNIGFLLSGIILTNMIVHSNTFKVNRIIFFDQFLESVAIGLIANIVGYFLKMLSSCEAWYYSQSKHINTIAYAKMLIGHIIIIALFVILNALQLIYQDEPLSFLMVESITFNSSTYNCPEEQFAYSILSLYLGYGVCCMLMNYIPTMKKIVLNYICTSSKAVSEIERSLYNITPLNPLDKTIPLIVLNVLSLCISPVFPFVFILSTPLLLLIFLHNYHYAIRYAMPSFETINRYQIQTIITQFYTLSNCLAFIFLGAFFSFSYQTRYFQSDHTTLRMCGAYNSNQTPLSSFQSYLEQNSFIGAVYNAINFRPLLWVLFLFFLFSFIIKNATQQEWKLQYKQKSKELYLVKSHFQDKVFGLQDKITQARSNSKNNNNNNNNNFNNNSNNLNNISNNINNNSNNYNYNHSPKNVTPTNRLTAQRELLLNSIEKNSPAHSTTFQGHSNQNNSTQQINSNNSLNIQLKENNNNNIKPSLFSRTQKSSSTYVGIGNIVAIPDSFTSVINKLS